MTSKRVVIQPWHDCPACPSCGAHVAVPIDGTDRFYAPKEGKANLFCPACGQGFEGFPGEVEQAERAQAAWEAEQEREERAAADRRKAQLDRQKYERLMKGGW